MHIKISNRFVHICGTVKLCPVSQQEIQTQRVPINTVPWSAGVLLGGTAGLGNVGVDGDWQMVADVLRDDTSHRSLRRHVCDDVVECGRCRTRVRGLIHQLVQLQLAQQLLVLAHTSGVDPGDVQVHISEQVQRLPKRLRRAELLL